MIDHYPIIRMETKHKSNSPRFSTHLTVGSPEKFAQRLGSLLTACEIECRVTDKLTIADMRSTWV